MIYPALMNAWDQQAGAVAETMSVFGLIEMPLKGYQGTLLPILLVIFLMSVIERNVRKIIPNMLDILLTPLITVLATGFLSLVVVGPIANWVGDGISVFLQFAINNFGIFAGIIFGGLYSAMVISGIHHSFHAIELGLISSTGFNTLLPIWAVANFAQGGAALAVYFKTKNKKIKAISLTAIAITTSDTMLNYCIGLVIAGVVSFVATWIIGVKEEA